MPIPSNFSSPHESNHKYYLNLCYDFKKKINSLRDPNELEFEMEKMINASRDIDWKKNRNEHFKKDEEEKALSSLLSEVERYTQKLRNGSHPETQDMLNALDQLIAIVQGKRIF